MPKIDLDNLIGTVVAKIAFDLITSILNYIISGKLTIDEIPLMRDLGIANKAEAQAFLERLRREAIG